MCKKLDKVGNVYILLAYNHALRYTLLATKHALLNYYYNTYLSLGSHVLYLESVNMNIDRENMVN